MISLVGLSTTTLLWIAGGVGATISVLYLLRLRRRQVVVPFLPLWQKVIKQSQYQSLWQRLKRLLSWMIQLFLLLLLLLALGDPRLRAELLSGRHVVVILDTSASMQTMDGQKEVTPKDDKKANNPKTKAVKFKTISRLEEAKHRTRKIMKTLVGNDRMMLISMDSEVVPLTPFTVDQKLLEKKLSDLKPSETKSNLRRALLLAKDALEGRKMSEIVVISDGAFGVEVEQFLKRKGLKATVVQKRAVTPKRKKPTAANLKAKASDRDQVKGKPEPRARTKPKRRAKRTRRRRTRKRRRRRTRRKRSRKRTRARKKPVKIKLPKGLKRRIDLTQLSQVSSIHRKVPRFEWVKVGKSTDNVGIVALSARRRPNHPLQFSVYVELHNFGSQPVEGFLELFVGDLIMETVRVKLKPSQRWRHILPRLTAQGQRLSAKLKIIKGKDLLKADNQAYAILPKARAMRVLLVSEDNLYLQAALLADPQITMNAASCGKESSVKGKFDVYIYNNCLPTIPPTSGRFLFVNPPAKNSPFSIRTKRGKPVYLKGPIITEQRDAHSIMRFISLRDLNIRRALRMRLGKNDKSLVASFGKPLIIIRETKSLRAIGIGFSLQESDMVLRVAFPLFLRNTLEWLARGGRSAPPTTRQTGQVWKIPLPSSVKEVTLTSPKKGPSIKLPVSDGLALFSGKRSGFYKLSYQKKERWIAANLADPDESRITPGTWDPIQGKKTTHKEKPVTGIKVLGMQIPIPRPMWMYLLLLVVVLLGVEWITYNRRITV